MYSFNLVKTPTECASCGTLVTARLAGHCYQDPMCDACFRLAAPEHFEAALRFRSEFSVRQLETRRHGTCANCGGDLVGERFAGHHFDDPLCTVCFQGHSRELAALLFLHQAALEAAAGGRDAPGLLTVAISYSRMLYHLDARRAEEPSPRDLFL